LTKLYQNADNKFAEIANYVQDGNTAPENRILIRLKIRTETTISCVAAQPHRLMGWQWNAKSV